MVFSKAKIPDVIFLGHMLACLLSIYKNFNKCICHYISCVRSATTTGSYSAPLHYHSVHGHQLPILDLS